MQLGRKAGLWFGVKVVETDRSNSSWASILGTSMIACSLRGNGNKSTASRRIKGNRRTRYAQPPARIRIQLIQVYVGVDRLFAPRHRHSKSFHQGRLSLSSSRRRWSWRWGCRSAHQGTEQSEGLGSVAHAACMPSYHTSSFADVESRKHAMLSRNLARWNPLTSGSPCMHHE